MACPYFMPEERLHADWLFPQRLPLGAGWAGTCTAPGHDGARPDENELKSGCNMGYARSCHRLPADREVDAVRFVVGQEKDGVVHVRFSCERAHLPAGHGELLYEKANATWLSKHDDVRIQRMAECYLEAQMQRRAASATATS